MLSETIWPCTLVLYIISKELCKELREISSLVIAIIGTKPKVSFQLKIETRPGINVSDK